MEPDITTSPGRNRILAALPDDEMRLFREYGQKIKVHVGKVLQEPGVPATSIYFPVDAIISLVAVTEDGLSVEVGLVGREGIAGLSPFFGGGSLPFQCLVQRDGEICQMEVDRLRRAALPTLQRFACRYANYRLTELAQSVLCNRFHRVRQRFARWLLTLQDRTGDHQMEFTQEALASMVGARRPVVASLIGDMAAQGAIACTRGCVAIRDRAKLERAACECYGVVAKAADDFIQSLGGAAPGGTQDAAPDPHVPPSLSDT
jgi:CRP-like cAMP-binding protein